MSTEIQPITFPLSPLTDDLANFVTRFQLQRAPQAKPVRQVHKAAVLVPIVCHADAPTLLLTRRASTLRKHAGQVAFPGGAADSSDASLIDTALREAQEEVSIAPEVVTVLGTLPPPLDIERQRQTHRVYLSWYRQQFVWGLTAAIIRQLALQVSASTL